MQEIYSTHRKREGQTFELQFWDANIEVDFPKITFIPLWDIVAVFSIIHYFILRENQKGTKMNISFLGLTCE